MEKQLIIFSTISIDFGNQLKVGFFHRQLFGFLLIVKNATSVILWGDLAGQMYVEVLRRRSRGLSAPIN